MIFGKKNVFGKKNFFGKKILVKNVFWVKKSSGQYHPYFLRDE